jgi:hypothetical protein
MTDEKRTDAAGETPRGKRLTQAALNDALARKRCSHCATRGAWKIYSQDGKGGAVRYVKCLGCGRTDKVPVIATETDDETQTRQT